jgi:hypothetical protein
MSKQLSVVILLLEIVTLVLPVDNIAVCKDVSSRSFYYRYKK